MGEGRGGVVALGGVSNGDSMALAAQLLEGSREFVGGDVAFCP